MTGQINKDIWIKAAELIEQPGCWFQGDHAGDSDGNPVEFDDPAAVCWCAEGAIKLLGGEIRIFNERFVKKHGCALNIENDAVGMTAARMGELLREMAA